MFPLKHLHLSNVIMFISLLKIFKAAFLFPSYSGGKRQLSQNTLVHKIFKMRSVEINSTIAYDGCAATPRPVANIYLLIKNV